LCKFNKISTEDFRIASVPYFIADTGKLNSWKCPTEIDTMVSRPSGHIIVERVIIVCIGDVEGIAAYGCFFAELALSRQRKLPVRS
jgi:hypothetical protein